MKIIKFNWDFIEQNLPNYYSRDDVLESDILGRYINNEDVLESDTKWIQKIGSLEAISAYTNQLNSKLYKESLENCKHGLNKEKLAL